MSAYSSTNVTACLQFSLIKKTVPTRYSILQLDVRNLSLGMRHQVNAYEVEACTV